MVVSSLLTEAGFESAEKASVETLTEMLQSCKYRETIGNSRGLPGMVPGVFPRGVGRAGVEGSLRLLCWGRVWACCWVPWPPRPPLWGVGVRVPAMGSCLVVAGWGCVVWRGGLRTGEWTRADRVAAFFGVAGRGLLVLMYFDRVPVLGVWLFV